MRRFFYTLFLLLALGSPLYATDHHPADCEITTLNALVVADGDYIYCPSGEWTWNTYLGDPGDGFFVHLIGNGDENTIINISYGGQVLRHPYEVAYVKMVALSGSAGSIINTARDGFRFHHSTFENQTGGGTCINIANAILHPEGLIDQNTFLNCRILVSPGYLGETPPGLAAWSADSKIGMTDRVIFVERNYFTRDDGATVNAIDHNTGGSSVFRYNYVLDYPAEAHSVQGDNRGTRSWEFYGNIFERGSAWQNGMFLRAGTGMVFDNTCVGPISNCITIDNIRSDSNAGVYGPCDGDAAEDGNEPGLFGYPCRDQIGRGKDGAGTFPNKPQELEPAYFFHNTGGTDGMVGGNNCFDTYKIGGSCTDIQAGRDYYSSEGASPGVLGYGVRASRPMSANEGEAYWSTDAGGDWKTVDYDVETRESTVNGDANDGCLDIYRDAAWVDCAYTPSAFPHALALDDAPPDDVDPTVGGGGTLSATVGINVVTLGWTEGTDDTSLQTALTYTVYRSLSNNIDTVENAEANGSVVKGATADISSAQLSGLLPSTTYYFNVIVSDEAGNKAAYTQKSVTTVGVSNGRGRARGRGR